MPRNVSGRSRTIWNWSEKWTVVINFSLHHLKYSCQVSWVGLRFCIRWSNSFSLKLFKTLWPIVEVQIPAPNPSNSSKRNLINSYLLQAAGMGLFYVRADVKALVTGSIPKCPLPSGTRQLRFIYILGFMLLSMTGILTRSRYLYSTSKETPVTWFNTVAADEEPDILPNYSTHPLICIIECLAGTGDGDRMHDHESHTYAPCTCTWTQTSCDIWGWSGPEVLTLTLTLIYS